MPEDAQKKDAWDRLTALATILVPAAIALAGHFVGQGIQQAEIRSEERRAAQAHSIAAANTKVAQASLINTMMKSLTSANPQERKLAVQAVLIALPEQGPVLVRTIAQNDEEESVRDAASTSLEQRFHGLVRNLFSEVADVRIAAAQDLIQGWRNDSSAVRALIDFATENSGNSNGVYNTVVVLSEFSTRTLQDHDQVVREFAELARTQGPMTEAKARALIKRLGV